MKIYVRTLGMCLFIATCVMGCTGDSGKEELVPDIEAAELSLELNRKPPIKLFPDTAEETEDTEVEDQEEVIPKKQVTDSFIYYNLYYYVEEEVWYPSDAWETLKNNCVEAVERETWESFLKEYLRSYRVMTQVEKEDYAHRDESGILDCYIREMGIDDLWILYTSTHGSQDIFIRRPYAEEEGKYIYYIFETFWQQEERIYYNQALRALGSDEFYFLQCDQEDFFVLIDHTDDNKLKGIAAHKFEDGEQQTILYFKVDQGKRVSEIVMYGSAAGEQKYAGLNCSYWPEYPK